MLLRFGVENHGSIASSQELSLIATSLKDSEEGLIDIPHHESSGRARALKVAPVAAIYGANAAGKSTLLKAFDHFVKGIISSHSRTGTSVGTPYTPFLLDDISGRKPSQYDVDIVLDSTRYSYGYSVDGKKIVSEWLYSFALDAERQTRSMLFERKTSPDASTVDIRFGKSLKGENKQIAKLVRANSLFLSVAAQNAHPQLAAVYEFFYRNVIRRLVEASAVPTVEKQLAAYFGSDQQRQAAAIQFLRAADIGISGMKFSKVPVSESSRQLSLEFEQAISRFLAEDGLKLPDARATERDTVALEHVGANATAYPIQIADESAGTLALLQLIGPVFSCLSDGGLLVIDELNSKLHPLVSRELIRLFSTRISNPGKAQLIFTTHDTNLLCGDLLRRDQIWFAEKDNEGSTHLYSLSDIKVRAGDNFERGYLQGRFGAIPFVGTSLRDFMNDWEAVGEGSDR